MRFEKKGWYTVELPEGWTVDEDEDPVAIYHPDGVGALQVSAETPRLSKAGEKPDVFLMLRAFLRGTGVDIDAIPSRRGSARGMDWAEAEYVEDSPQEGKVFWLARMVVTPNSLVFLTYACAEEDKERERAAVDAILASLELR